MFRNDKSVLLSLSVCSTSFTLAESSFCHKTTNQKDPNGDNPIKVPVRQPQDRIKVYIMHMWSCNYRLVLMPLQLVVQATGVLSLYLSL